MLRSKTIRKEASQTSDWEQTMCLVTEKKESWKEKKKYFM